MQPQNPLQPQQGQPTIPTNGEPTQPYSPVAQPYAAAPQTQSAPAYAPQPYQAPTQGAPAPVQQQPAAPTLQQQSVDNVTQYPVDYLNTIAAPMPVKKASPLFVFSLIGGILLSTGIGLFMIIKSTSPPDVSTQIYTAQARLDTLVKVTSEQGTHLTQNDLSSINSTLGATLKSMQANLKSYADTKGYKTAKQPVTIKKTETLYYEKLSQTLNDSYLTGTLDRTYSGEMSYQLTLLKSKLQKLKAAANSKAFTEFYNKNIPSLDTVIEQLSKFQSTK